MNIAVFASGTGTTLQALIDQQTTYGYKVTLLVANRECPAIERAQNHGIRILQSKDWEQIDKTLNINDINLIVLAGFLAIIPEWLCTKWDKRIINTHPSLLPKFGGKGMYGMHVHEAVWKAGEKMTGCTVHYVSAEIDSGSIIAQSVVEVKESDTPNTIAQRVQAAEKLLLPRVIGEMV